MKITGDRKRLPKLKLYVEMEYGGILVPLEARIMRGRLVIEVTKDSRGLGEISAIEAMKMIAELLKATGIEHETDMPAHHKKSPHRITFLLKN